MIVAFFLPFTFNTLALRDTLSGKCTKKNIFLARMVIPQ